MELKNKSINIFGTKYKIKYVDKIYDGDNNWIYGMVNSADKEILISTLSDKDKPVQQDEIKLTLYHELVHAMLILGQYMQCSDDEPLVEWLARCLFAIEKQGFFK